ncbi:S8 family peptidase [Terasakiella sp. SH-1]|uniref:S8 family peptidase n=1 Tax=Terasakiella sp. SH-1 TaxID=2560057 RepID=UPI00142FBC87|nr:S8 family peptidase [Terasakiella sp. SH-1]
MRTLIKYTCFLPKIHSFAFIFSILFLGATPQIPKAFADGNEDGIRVFQTPLEAQAIEGEFLVQFKTDTSLKSLQSGTKPSWVRKLGKDAKIDTSLSAFNIAHIKTTNPAASGQWENLANTLSSDPNIAAVEPNYILHATGTKPNDEFIDELWHLNKVSAFQAWDRLPSKRSDDEEIIVAVVDSGIQLDHEDLHGLMWKNKREIPDNLEDDDNNGFVDDTYGWNFHDDNPIPYAHLNPTPVLAVDSATGRFKCTGHPTKREYELHGTHVAGIIAAARNNQIGIAGIYDRIKILPIKALGGPCGSGDTISVLRSVLYAYQMGARIINMSLGGYGKTKMAKNVYDYLSKRGVLVIAAAGNEANNNDERLKSYPASYEAPGILSVAATNRRDQLAEFSNFGPRNVDIAAPGVKILSTVPRDVKRDWPKSSYYSTSGTSMAAPVVSGAAALLLAQNPRLTNLQLKSMLMSGTDPLPSLKGKVLSGGRLNIAKALSQRVVVTKEQSSERSPAPAYNQRPTSPTQNTQQPTSNSVGGIRIFDSRTGRSESMRW